MRCRWRTRQAAWRRATATSSSTLAMRARIDPSGPRATTARSSIGRRKTRDSSISSSARASSAMMASPPRSALAASRATSSTRDRRRIRPAHGAGRVPQSPSAAMWPPCARRALGRNSSCCSLTALLPGRSLAPVAIRRLRYLKTGRRCYMSAQIPAHLDGVCAYIKLLFSLPIIVAVGWKLEPDR